MSIKAYSGTSGTLEGTISDSWKCEPRLCWYCVQTHQAVCSPAGGALNIRGLTQSRTAVGAKQTSVPHAMSVANIALKAALENHVPMTEADDIDRSQAVKWSANPQLASAVAAPALNFTG